MSGDWLLNFLTENFETGKIIDAFHWLRFVIMFLMFFFVILGIYIGTSPKNDNVGELKGALFSSLALVVVSAVFSYFIDKSVRYSAIYGSLASIIILMTWMFMCGNILIIGKILNLMWSDPKYNSGKVKRYNK